LNLLTFINKRDSTSWEFLEEDHEFFELGNQVCGDEAVWAALEEYATKNAILFRVM
jgi:hypothetical protein